MILIINTDKTLTPQINQILAAQVPDLSTEANGYSVFKHNKSEFFISEYKASQISANIAYDGSKIQILHFRTKTSGSSDHKGLHLQNVRGWYFGHNGTISGYSGAHDFSDSYHFVERLTKDNLTYKRIKQLAEEKHFTGKMVLYNPTLGRLIWFNNQPTYAYALSEKCLIFSTYKLNLSVATYSFFEAFNYQFIKETGKTSISIPNVDEFDNQFLEWQVKTMTMLAAVDFPNCWNTSAGTGNYTKNVYKEDIDDDYHFPAAPHDDKGYRV